MARDDYRLEVKLLTPLFLEAHEANLAFKRSHETLPRFQDSHRRLEEAIRPAQESIRAGRTEGVDRALAYLSIRLRPHRSGYTSAALARALRHVSLEDRHVRLLREIILDRATWPWASVRDLWRWIPRLRTPDFENALRALSEHKTPWIARRAWRLIREFL